MSRSLAEGNVMETRLHYSASRRASNGELCYFLCCWLERRAEDTFDIAAV